MPYINLQITKGASREEKAALVSRFTGMPTNGYRRRMAQADA